jgi:hypothetical protein
MEGHNMPNYTKKAICKRGHPRTPDNVDANGRCRKCLNEQRSLPENYTKERHDNITRNAKYKLDVLTHYGSGGSLKCCGEGCEVSDIDMLTLDHINDDGCKHLDSFGNRYAGVALYLWALRNEYPSILQTLCANHQLKKAIVKLRNSPPRFRVKRKQKVLAGNPAEVTQTTAYTPESIKTSAWKREI